jgi:hypothetical protein
MSQIKRMNEIKKYTFFLKCRMMMYINKIITIYFSISLSGVSLSFAGRSALLLILPPTDLDGEQSGCVGSGGGEENRRGLLGEEAAKSKEKMEAKVIDISGLGGSRCKTGEEEVCR